MSEVRQLTLGWVLGNASLCKFNLMGMAWLPSYRTLLLQDPRLWIPKGSEGHFQLSFSVCLFVFPLSPDIPPGGVVKIPQATF